MYRLLRAYLDRGESEAIALSNELPTDFLLMDDLAGRNIAKALGLNVIGILAILKKAYLKGKITNLKAILDKLRMKGFWMSDTLYKQMLL
jgi:hypothetical protein